MESALTCSICLLDFGPDRRPMILKSCGHTLCEPCLTDWLPLREHCPVCKTPTISSLKDACVVNYQILQIANASRPTNILPDLKELPQWQQSPKVCSYWFLGICYRKGCKYAHGIPPTLNEANNANSAQNQRHPHFKVDICRHWLNGDCKFSNSAECSFAHGLREIRRSNRMAPNSICNGWVFGLCNKTASECIAAHGIKHLKGFGYVPDKLCPIWIMEGFCTNANCQFAHKVQNTNNKHKMDDKKGGDGRENGDSPDNTDSELPMAVYNSIVASLQTNAQQLSSFKSTVPAKCKATLEELVKMLSQTSPFTNSGELQECGMKMNAVLEGLFKEMVKALNLQYSQKTLVKMKDTLMKHLRDVGKHHIADQIDTGSSEIEKLATLPILPPTSTGGVQLEQLSLVQSCVVWMMALLQIYMQRSEFPKAPSLHAPVYEYRPKQAPNGMMFMNNAPPTASGGVKSPYTSSLFSHGFMNPSPFQSHYGGAFSAPPRADSNSPADVPNAGAPPGFTLDDFNSLMASALKSISLTPPPGPSGGAQNGLGSAVPDTNNASTDAPRTAPVAPGASISPANSANVSAAAAPADDDIVNVVNGENWWHHNDPNLPADEEEPEQHSGGAQAFHYYYNDPAAWGSFNAHMQPAYAHAGASEEFMGEPKDSEYQFSKAHPRNDVIRQKEQFN